MNEKLQIKKAEKSCQRRKEMKWMGTKDNRPLGQGYLPEKLPDVVVPIATKP
jgi:hypothetical protein